jgi:ABC-type transporter Mla MlaB component
VTAGAWQGAKSQDEGATTLRPAVTIAWAPGRATDTGGLWLDLYEAEGRRQGVVAPIGRLDRDGLGRLECALEQARRYRAERVTVDLSRVHHVDYRGVARLAACIEKSLAEGCEVRLDGVTRYLREIFRAAGVTWPMGPESGAGAACGAAPKPARGRSSALRRRTAAGHELVAGPGGAE